MTPELDIEKLEELAKKATPGPWRIDQHLGMIVATDGGPITGKANFGYVISANPATILSLIERLRVAEVDAKRYRGIRDESINFPIHKRMYCAAIQALLNSNWWEDVDKDVDDALAAIARKDEGND